VKALERARSILTERGPAEFARRGLAQLGSKQEFIVFELEMTEAPAPVTPRIPVDFRWLSVERLPELNRPDLDFTSEVIAEARRWLAQGDRCLVGYVDEKPVHYHWITTSLRDRPGCRLHLGPRTAFYYKEFTHADYRGQGINPAAHSVSLAACFDEGIRYAFREVRSTNTPSIRSTEKDGFREVGRYPYVRVMRYRRVLMSGDLVRYMTERAAIGEAGSRSTARRA